MNVQTYTATLNTPLFYASREGNLIETDPHLSSTALTHAIGYGYDDLQKDYVMQGDAATTPTYERLASLPFFVSNMTPISVDANERTFRTTSYTGELNITTTENSLVKALNAKGTKGIPHIRGLNDTGWHEVRNHLGLSPGSEFEFTVWTRDPLPDTLGFRMGIKRTGEFRARRISQSTVNPSLSKFLLTEAYDLPASEMADLLNHSDRFVRGSDPRLHRFEGVDIDYVTTTLAPNLIPEK